MSFAHWSDEIELPKRFVLHVWQNDMRPYLSVGLTSLHMTFRCRGSLRKFLPMAQPGATTAILARGSIQIFHRDGATSGQRFTHEHLPKMTTHAHGNP